MPRKQATAVKASDRAAAGHVADVDAHRVDAKPLNDWAAELKTTRLSFDMARRRHGLRTFKLGTTLYAFGSDVRAMLDRVADQGRT